MTWPLPATPERKIKNVTESDPAIPEAVLLRLAMPVGAAVTLATAPVAEIPSG